jgi:hypothetical protein
MLHKIKKALRMSPSALCRRVRDRIGERLISVHRRAKAYRSPTYSDRNISLPNRRWFSRLSLDILEQHREAILILANAYSDHRFEILGSGWIQARHGVTCRGFEGHRYDSSPVSVDRDGRWLVNNINSSNSNESMHIWRLISPGYEAIDWQRDMTSGFRWQERTWSGDIPYGDIAGADIKGPWELARMQHLPVLAYAYALTSSNPSDAQKYSREFRNEILDFIAQNPPGFGVNWICTMDVGIRAANWVISYELIRSAGACFDIEFETLFARSLWEHGQHIVNNLEWNDYLRANHYLADIASLAFVSAWLPTENEINAWLALSLQELRRCMDEQFSTEGSNFEASTAYHRLSAEMTIYSSALFLGLPAEKRAALKYYNDASHRMRPPLSSSVLLSTTPENWARQLFSVEYINRLARIADLSKIVTAPDGHIVQIGDNDSGRFFKLMPILMPQPDLNREFPQCSENHLNHTHLRYALDGLFAINSTDSTVPKMWETVVVRTLSDGINLQRTGPHTASHSANSDWSLTDRHWRNAKFREEYVITPPPGMHLTEGLQVQALTDFGIFVWRSKRVFLTIRCGEIGQNGNGGHAHNDALSLTLWIDGQSWIVDPGSFCYTADATIRNQYRSVTAHWAPQFLNGMEPAGIDQGLFSITGDPRSRWYYFSERRFWGEYHCLHHSVTRLVEMREDTIIIRDIAALPMRRLNLPDGINPLPRSPAFSRGYGLRMPSNS